MSEKNTLRTDLVRILDMRKQELELYLADHIVDCRSAGVGQVLFENHEGDLDYVAKKLRKVIDFARMVRPPIDLEPYINAGSKYGQLVA